MVAAPVFPCISAHRHSEKHAATPLSRRRHYAISRSRNQPEIERVSGRRQTRRRDTCLPRPALLRESRPSMPKRPPAAENAAREGLKTRSGGLSEGSPRHRDTRLVAGSAWQANLPERGAPRKPSADPLIRARPRAAAAAMITHKRGPCTEASPLTTAGKRFRKRPTRAKPTDPYRRESLPARKTRPAKTAAMANPG